MKSRNDHTKRAEQVFGALGLVIVFSLFWVSDQTSTVIRTYMALVVAYALVVLAYYGLRARKRRPDNSPDNTQQ
jgi:hypothetical protein